MQVFLCVIPLSLISQTVTLLGLEVWSPLVCIWAVSMLQAASLGLYWSQNPQRFCWHHLKLHTVILPQHRHKEKVVQMTCLCPKCVRHEMQDGMLGFSTTAERMGFVSRQVVTQNIVSVTGARWLWQVAGLHWVFVQQYVWPLCGVYAIFSEQDGIFKTSAKMPVYAKRPIWYVKATGTMLSCSCLWYNKHLQHWADSSPQKRSWFGYFYHSWKMLVQ